MSRHAPGSIAPAHCRTGRSSGGCERGSQHKVRVHPGKKFCNFMCEFVLCAALSGRKLTPAKVQNTTRFYSVTALRTVSFLFTFTVVYAWHFHTTPFVVCKLHYTFALYVSGLLYCLPTPTPNIPKLKQIFRGPYRLHISQISSKIHPSLFELSY